jgi:hypothetical protein
MFGLTKLALTGLTLGAGVVLSGCTANSTPAVAQASTQAITCSKCQVTWVKVPDMAKGRVVGYTSRKSHTCPDCKDAVANFFATGKFERTCRTCGDAMELCQGH